MWVPPYLPQGPNEFGSWTGTRGIRYICSILLFLYDRFIFLFSQPGLGLILSSDPCPGSFSTSCQACSRFALACANLCAFRRFDQGFCEHVFEIKIKSKLKIELEIEIEIEIEIKVENEIAIEVEIELEIETKSNRNRSF